MKQKLANFDLKNKTHISISYSHFNLAPRDCFIDITQHRNVLRPNKEPGMASDLCILKCHGEHGLFFHV
jgi:hypothetical protein